MGRALLTLVVLSALISATGVANVVDHDPENFSPTTNGLYFVTVQSSETLEPGIVNFGYFMDYAANTLPHFDYLVPTNRVNLNDFLLFAHLDAGIGLAKNWDMGVSLPYLVSETVRDPNYSGLFYSSGLTEIAFNTKFHLLGDQPGNGLAAILSMNINTEQDDPFTGINSGPTTNLELAYDHPFGRWNTAANVGYRFRQPGAPVPNVPVSPLPDSVIGSLGASYLFQRADTKLILELFGSYPTETVQYQSTRELSTLEALAGVKYDVTRSLALHGGAGTQVLNGTDSPDWRIYVGLNWEIGPVFDTGPQIYEAESGKDLLDRQPPDRNEKFIAHDILFRFDSDQLDPRTLETLGRLAKYLRKPPKYKHLVVEGHTDSIGSDLYNANLSERRARAVKEALVKNFGLDPGKIDAVGYGSKRPIASNGNYQGRKKNRRVEFDITR